MLLNVMILIVQVLTSLGPEHRKDCNALGQRPWSTTMLWQNGILNNKIKTICLGKELSLGAETVA